MGCGIYKKIDFRGVKFYSAYFPNSPMWFIVEHRSSTMDSLMSRMVTWMPSMRMRFFPFASTANHFVSWWIRVCSTYSVQLSYCCSFVQIYHELLTMMAVFCLIPSFFEFFVCYLLSLLFCSKLQYVWKFFPFQFVGSSADVTSRVSFNPNGVRKPHSVVDGICILSFWWFWIFEMVLKFFTSDVIPGYLFCSHWDTC